MLSPVLSRRPSHEVQASYFSSQPQSPPPARSSSSAVNMSWGRDEPLEFSSSHPLTSSLHMSMSVSPSTSVLSPSPYTAEGYVDHIPSLERDFCSNFTCCGLRLADLHELLEHFEESHILVLSADGTPVYPCIKKSTSPNAPSPPSPCDSSATSSSSADCPVDININTRAKPVGRAPYSSLVFNYPQPRPSPSPEDWPTVSRAASPHMPNPSFPALSFDHHSRISTADPAMDVDVLADFDAFDTDFSTTSSLAHSHLHAHASSSQSSLSSSSSCEPLALPPSSFTWGQEHRHMAKHRPNRLQKLQDDSVLHERKGVIAPASELSGADRKRSGSQQGQRVPKKREKMFRCPRPGCTKAYLNPNGLKYHVEKGTCKIEAEPV